MARTCLVQGGSAFPQETAHFLGFYTSGASKSMSRPETNGRLASCVSGVPGVYYQQFPNLRSGTRRSRGPGLGDGFMDESAGQVTQILEAVGAGDAQATEKLLPLVYMTSCAGWRLADWPANSDSRLWQSGNHERTGAA